jgi:3-hydroxyisobutyrate dehydrogenase-like beta-hydroxyacid dehydrogenase
MGLGMAKNLQTHLKATGSKPLIFTNRTMSRGAALEEIGGIPCATIAEVVQKADITFSSVWPVAIVNRKFNLPLVLDKQRRRA